MLSLSLSLSLFLVLVIVIDASPPASASAGADSSDHPLKRLRLETFLLFFSFLTLVPSPAQAAADPYTWARDAHLVANALGGLENKYAYTNAWETFTINYTRGHRVFEADFCLTRDGQLVGLHGWEAAFLQSLEIDITPQTVLPMSYDEFMRVKIHRRYTPVGARDLVTLLSRYPDTWLITDTKITSGSDMTKPFSLLVDAARQIDPAVLDRIIPQVYNQAMYSVVKAVYPFKSWIYTLYASQDTNAQVEQFVANNGIRVVVLPAPRVTPAFMSQLKAQGVYTYVHTIDTVANYNALAAQGVYGVYTFFLRPQDLGYGPPDLTATRAWTINLPWVE